ncbi:MAG: globin [Dermatophilaceae bacterium]
MSFYQEVGGHPTFVRLVGGFYAGVADDPPLRALYPEADLAAAQQRLLMFLEQYFGGPTAYSQQRGHPRLRMRHAPYAVTPQQRDRWLGHMLASVDELAADGTLDSAHVAVLRDYLTRAADMLVNSGVVGPPPIPGGS